MARVIALLLIIFPFGVLAAERPVQIERLLSKEGEHLNVIAVSSGALDSTHDQYHLALVADENDTSFFYFIRETPNGVTEIKDKIDVGGAGSRSSWTSEIRKQSAFILVESSGGCCSHGGVTYQLKLDDKKQLLLIGYEEMNLSSSDGKIFVEDRFSINLITGDAQKSHAESKNIEDWTEKSHFTPSGRMFKLLAPVKRKIYRFRVPIEKRWGLEDLGVGIKEDGKGFDDWLLKIYDSKK